MDPRAANIIVMWLFVFNFPMGRYRNNGNTDLVCEKHKIYYS